MNNIYKVIWSKAKNCYVVASEIARSHTKSASGSEKIGGVARRSLLASLMALSLLCGGLGVAEATVHVVESGVTYEVLTTQEVTEELDKKVSKEVADLTYAKASDVATNTKDIATNKGNISELNGKLTNLTTVVDGKVDKADTLAGYNIKDAYTKGDIDDKLNKKADAANVYTKTYVDANFATSDALTTAKTELDAKIDANTKKITDLQTTTNGQQTAIDGLNTKTTEISYDPAKGTTVKGVEFTDAEVNANGKGLTGVSTLNTTGNATVGGELNANGKVSGNGLDAKTGEIKGGSLSVTGAVTGNSVNTGTLSTTGNATVGGDLSAKNTEITGTLHATGETTLDDKLTVKGEAAFEKNVTMENDLEVKGELKTDKIAMENKKTDADGRHNSSTTITADYITHIGEVEKSGVNTKSSFTHNEEGSETYAKKGDTANWTETHSDVKADGVFNKMTDFDKNTHTYSQTATESKEQLVNGDKSKSNFEKKTAEGNTISITEKDAAGNPKSSLTNTQTVNGEKTSVTNKDSSSTIKQGADQIRYNVTSKDENKTSSSIEVKADGITNTSKDGTITNDAKDIENNATGDITNTAQNGSIINNAENGDISNTAKNVTNVGTVSVTNTVGKNEVKVSTDGVDIKAEDGKKITESVGTASRVVENDKITDKAADSTVTTEKGKGTTFGKEGSTGTTNIHGDSIKTGKINAEDTTTDKLTAGAAAGVDGGRLTVDAKDGVKGSYKSDKYTSKSYILANTLQSGVDNGQKPTDADFVGSRTDHYMEGDKAKLNETVKDADGSNVTKKTSTKTYTEIKDTNGNTLSVNQKADGNNYKLEDQDGNTNHVTNSATQSKQTLKDKDGNTLTTNQTATKNNFDLKSADGSKENHTTNTVDESRVAIKGENGKAELSTTDEGTTFKHSAAKEAFTEGGATNTTIKGNTITTGKVTMDYADVMKDLGVYGNTTLGEAGKDTTLTVNSKATFNEIATFENGAEVKNGLTVSSGGLNVTGESTFNDKVNMKNGLDVTGGVASDSFTVKGTDIKIDSSGINAGGTVISNVADGSISEGSKDAVNGGQLYQVKNDLEGKVNKVGANAAAMANLHPMEFDPDSKWNIAAAIGNYGSETAAALGAFYRPNDDVMVNLSTAFGTGENMVGGGVSVRLGQGGNKLSREDSNQLKAQVADLTARMDALLSVLNPNMSKDFPDVPENHWAYEAVSRLAGNDIVQGYPDGEFHGERTMTRYEMAEIIYNALSRGAEAEKELVEEFKPELQAMAASEKATAERAEG